MKRCILALGLLLSACAARTASGVPDTPEDAARHNAALALISVSNNTTSPLAIAFRNATPPVQEVIIGRVEAGQRARMAPVPAGEPIALIARRADGSELTLAARLFMIDVEWTWEISHTATFTQPAKAK
jgi:hypothetical protein